MQGGSGTWHRATMGWLRLGLSPDDPVIGAGGEEDGFRRIARAEP
jgi:hypothetical protein